MQSILRDDFEEVKEFIKFFDDKSSIIDFNFFNSFITKDEKLMKDMILKVVSPKEHKKRVKACIFDTTFSEVGLLFAKLAYIKGYKLDINHPLIPMELVEVSPNDEYWEYDFMKDKGIKNV